MWSSGTHLLQEMRPLCNCCRKEYFPYVMWHRVVWYGYTNVSGDTYALPSSSDQKSEETCTIVWNAGEHDVTDPKTVDFIVTVERTAVSHQHCLLWQCETQDKNVWAKCGASGCQSSLYIPRKKNKLALNTSKFYTRSDVSSELPR